MRFEFGSENMILDRSQAALDIHTGALGRRRIAEYINDTTINIFPRRTHPRAPSAATASRRGKSGLPIIWSGPRMPAGEGAREGRGCVGYINVGVINIFPPSPVHSTAPVVTDRIRGM